MRNPFLRNISDQKPTIPAHAADQDGSKPDERVRLALEMTGYVPLTNRINDFFIAIDYSGDRRSQQIFIGSKTQTSIDREWRQVWSWAFSVPGKLPWDQALALLDESNRPLIGSWFTQETDGSTDVGYQVAVPADASHTELDIVIQMVSEIADDLEKATIGTDDN